MVGVDHIGCPLVRVANCKIGRIAFVMALSLCAACWGQTRLEVRRGWGDKERAGRWNPVVVRASDRAPQDAMLEIVSPTEGGFGTSIREHVAIGPAAATFELFAPNHYSPSRQSVVVVRDAESERTITQFPDALAKPARNLSELGPGGVLIGISGRETQLLSVVQSGVADAGYLPPRFLPRAAIGYDAIEILYLNQPRIDELEAEQKRAILDWVRSGGSLLVCPADGPVPANDALTAALPCRVGDVTSIEIAPTALKEVGLPARFARLAGRALTPAPGARPIQLFPGSNVIAYSGRLGMGRIIVAPIDLASIEFDPGAPKPQRLAFWRPTVTELIGGAPPEPKRQYDYPYYGYESESEDQEREGAATGTVCDFVAAPMGSRFDIPLTLLAILFVIGPVDSVVLFALGRRAWTWTTTPAWLALIGGGVGVTVAHLRPNDVECRIVRGIDQVDDATVATTELIGLSSSARGRIESAGGATGNWWQPAIPGLASSQEIRPQPNLRFHASNTGMESESILIEAGTPRFLRADRVAMGRAIVRTSLSMTGPVDAPRLTGSIQNVSARSLKNLRVRTKSGVVTVPLGSGGTLAPGQTVSVNVDGRGEPFAPEKVEGQYQSYGYFGSRHLSKAVRETDLWEVVPDLAGRRTLHVDQAISGGDDFACVYAQTVDPPMTVSLAGGGRKVERVFEWARALVPLNH